MLLPGGRPPRTGEVMRMPLLAKTFKVGSGKVIGNNTPFCFSFSTNIRVNYFGFWVPLLSFL